MTPCKYKFSTPGGSSIEGKGVNIFSHGNTNGGKENNIVLDTSPMTQDGAKQNFAMLAHLAINSEKGGMNISDELIEMSDLTAQNRGSNSNSRRNKRRKNQVQNYDNAQENYGVQRGLAERDSNVMI